jgi:hypothetical protein
MIFASWMEMNKELFDRIEKSISCDNCDLNKECKRDRSWLDDPKGKCYQWQRSFKKSEIEKVIDPKGIYMKLAKIIGGKL